MNRAWDAARSLVSGSGPLASFARFAGLGCGLGLLSSAAVTLLALSMPWMIANALITVATTILGTELHARFTFGCDARSGWGQHLQSAGTAAAAYVATSAAMVVLHLLCSAPSVWTEQIVYLGASALAGILRFVLLRVLVFAAARPTPLTKLRRTLTAMPERVGAMADSGLAYAGAAPNIA